MGNRPCRLVELAVADDPGAWSAHGFTVGDDGVCRVGGVRIRLTGGGVPGRGIVGWSLAGCTLAGDDVDGVPTTAATGAGPVPGDPPTLGDVAPAHVAPAHPNGTLAIDHVVLVTPDLDRTTAAVESLGLEARRTREAGGGRLQRFFRLGEVILEVVGPAEPSGRGPARLWGLAFTVADLDATAGHLDARIGPARPAVQAGRRIATLRAGDQVSVPVAFMSPEPDRRGPRSDPGQRL